MRTIIKSFLIAVCFIVLTACAGRPANPVMVQQYGDHNKSCDALGMELQFIETEISRLVPDTEKTGTNTALGVAGFFLIVPWFFMDFSDAEQIEVNAYRQRYNNLVIIATEKECGMDKKVVPEISPEAEQEEFDVDL